jgi:hypothetical protein
MGVKMNKAFIFTMDAVMALVPIFIITASVSQISGMDSLVAHGSLLSGEKIAQGTLEIMGAREETEETNLTLLNNTLLDLIPYYYNFAYEVEFNGSTILNVTKGNVSSARDVMVARRLDYIKLYSLLGIVSDVSHGGSPSSSELCPRNGNQPPIYESTFDIDVGDLSVFDYWVEGSAPDAGVRAWYYVTNTSMDCASLQGGALWTSFMVSSETSAKVQVDGILEDGKTNYLYLRIAANPNREGDFYVIKAPQDTDQSLVNYQNAIKRNFAWVSLKVWR